MRRTVAAVCSVVAVLAAAACAPGTRTQLVSVDRDERPVGGEVLDVTRDGRYVLMERAGQAVVRDRVGGTTFAAPVASAFQVSDDLRHYLYEAADGVAARWDTRTGTGRRANQAAGTRYVDAFLSDNGRYVAYSLVPATFGPPEEIFVRDMDTNDRWRVDVSSEEQPSDSPPCPYSGTDCFDWRPGNRLESISDDGRWIGFSSDSTNLAGPDTNGDSDAYVRDRVDGRTLRVSTRPDGGPFADGAHHPKVSGNGRYVVFLAYADPASLFVRDLVAGTTRKILHGYDFRPLSISDDGSRVSVLVFESYVSSDTNGYFDIYVKDWQAGTLERASLGANGEQAPKDQTGGEGLLPWKGLLSGDGNALLFESRWDGYVAGDDNGVDDVFLRVLQP